MELSDHTAPPLAIVASIAMAMALHVQPMVHIGGNLIRISLSDFVLLPLLAFPIVLLARMPRLFPWHCIVWVAVLSATMTVSFIIGWLEIGQLTTWAVTKVVGIYLLAAYFLTGAAIAGLGSSRAKEMFAVTFVLSMAALVALFLIVNLFTSGRGTFLSYAGRFAGLSGNPNAVGLMLVLALCLAIAYAKVFERLIMRGATLAIGALLSAGLIMTASIATWAAAAVSVAAFVFLRMIDARRVSMLIAIASLGLFATILLVSNGDPAGLKHQLRTSLSKMCMATELALSTRQRSACSRRGYEDVNARTSSNRAAFRYWLKAPILGKGLGYFLSREGQATKRGKKPIQVHNTLLWLLAETGLTGAIPFIGFLLCAGIILNRTVSTARRTETIEAVPFIVALLVFYVAWQIMSLAHELMYQRYVWFALGMALAREPRMILEPDAGTP